MESQERGYLSDTGGMTMTEQDKQLLLADLCARLPYGVFVNVEGFGYDFNGKLVQVYFGNINRCSIQVGSNISYSLEETKPWLRPMSSMTKDEFNEYNQQIYKGKPNSDGRSYNTFEVESLNIDWLNAHHFDFRCLIEKGLAISTEEFNPYD